MIIYTFLERLKIGAYYNRRRILLKGKSMFGIVIRVLFMPIIFAMGVFCFSGCDTVDSKFDVPDGRNSSNDRYSDDDIIGPVLKLHLKETPEQQKKQQDKLQKQALDADY